jgi:signal transduction histidine kinase
VHDVLAHTITVIAVQAAAATEALDDRPEDAREALGAVRGAAREAMTELRSTLALLRTGPVDPGAPHPGLPQLHQLRQRAEAAGTAVTLTVVGDRSLPPAVERAIFRIVQEALTNTIRHAAASTATVAIDLTGAEVTVEVTDDGTATDVDAAAGGHGLAGMRERARALGGSLDAGPRPDGGFRVAARLPA